MANKNNDLRYIDLTSLTTAFKKHFWVGTKDQLEAALTAGEISDNTFVKVTDDYESASSSSSSGGDSSAVIWPVSIDCEATGVTAAPYGWFISTTIKDACINKLGQDSTKSPIIVPFMICRSGPIFCLKGHFIISILESSASLSANVEWAADNWTLTVTANVIAPLLDGSGQTGTTLFIGTPIANGSSDGKNWIL